MSHSLGSRQTEMRSLQVDGNEVRCRRTESQGVFQLDERQERADLTALHRSAVDSEMVTSRAGELNRRHNFQATKNFCEHKNTRLEARACRMRSSFSMIMGRSSRQVALACFVLETLEHVSVPVEL